MFEIIGTHSKLKIPKNHKIIYTYFESIDNRKISGIITINIITNKYHVYKVSNNNLELILKQNSPVYDWNAIKSKKEK